MLDCLFSPIPSHLTYLLDTVTLVCDRNSLVHRLSAVGASLLPAGMERFAREQQRCPPRVHRVVSPKRYASEDSEGRPAAILSYQFQSRVNRMFPHALTKDGLCAICSSSGRGIVWCPSGPVSCASCGYEYSNPSEQGSSISLDNSDVPSGLLVSSEKRVPMMMVMSVVRRLFLLVSAMRSHAEILPVGAMPPQAEILVITPKSADAANVVNSS